MVEVKVVWANTILVHVRRVNVHQFVVRAKLEDIPIPRPAGEVFELEDQFARFLQAVENGAAPAASAQALMRLSQNLKWKLRRRRTFRRAMIMTKHKGARNAANALNVMSRTSFAARPPSMRSLLHQGEVERQEPLVTGDENGIG